MTSNWGNDCSECGKRMRIEAFRYTLIEMGERVLYRIHYCQACDLYHWIKEKAE